MDNIRTQNEGEIEGIFICKACNHISRDKYNYKRHLSTAKHINRTKIEPPIEHSTPFNKNEAVRQNNEGYDEYVTTNNLTHKKNTQCSCGKIYSSRSALWYHKKRCHLHNEVSENAESIDTPPPPENKVVQEGMNESIVIKCFQTMMEAQAAEAQAMQAAQAEQTRLLIEAISLNGMQCITNNNTTNNQFNLNVFLNEDCKDAYTLKEVAESIECTVSDLDRMDKDGYAATVTRKILESIENMSITERPIHCTDSRRNAVCVKSETGWERNEEALNTLNSTIFLIGNKIHGMMDAWRAKYPEHFKGSESRRKQYHRLVLEVIKVSDPVTGSHIVKKVCSGVILDRKAAMAR